MTADYDPGETNYEVIVSANSLTGPNDELKALYKRGKAARSLHDTGALPTPAELAEMRARVEAAHFGQWMPDQSWGAVISRVGPLDSTLIALMQRSSHEADAAFIAAAHQDMPRLIDAVEALTDENARLKATIADPQMVHLAMLRGAIAKPCLRNMLHLEGTEALKTWDEAVEARATIERLEREWDTSLWELEAYKLFLTEAINRPKGVVPNGVVMVEGKARLDESFGAPAPALAEVPPNDALKAVYQRGRALRDVDDGWYSAMRTEVEAAHASAKTAKRQAECRNCRDGFPAYAEWPNLHVCPHCGRGDAATAPPLPAERVSATSQLPIAPETVRGHQAGENQEVRE